MNGEQKLAEFKADPLAPKMVWEGEDEIYDGAVRVEWPGEGEVAVHVTRESDDAPVSSVYATPSEALLLAERIRTCALLAEKLGRAAPHE
jgi:hypothetical protein